MRSDPYLVLNRAIDVQRCLDEAGIANALGGALALAFHVDQPRTTDDIDVNISLPSTQAATALEALPPDVPWDDTTVARIARDDQVRIMWPVEGESRPLPLDLFFMADAFHEVVRERTQVVSLLDTQVRILSATDLTVFKALFARSKDWPDIEAMLTASASAVDLDEAVRWVGAIVGQRDPRTIRLRSMA